MRPTVEFPWEIEAERLLGALGVDAATGLAREEAERRLAADDPNELVEQRPRPTVNVFLSQQGATPRRRRPAAA